jgi:hypothetical protein
MVRPPFGGAPGSAGFLFFGSLAVNSKMLSRANHGADDANMPATIIAHTPIAITMLRRVILIADTSCLTVLLQNTIYHPVTEVYRDHALHSSACRTSRLTYRRRGGRWGAERMHEWRKATERKARAAVRCRRVVGRHILRWGPKY